MLKHIKKIAALMFFIILILMMKLHLDSLSKEYLLDIADTATFYEISESDGFVYFGSSTCPSCKLFKPLLTEVAKEENIQVFYFDINYFVNNSLLTEDELTRILDKYRIIQVPALIKLVNGSLDSNYGTNFTEAQSEEIKEQIRDFITYKEFPIKYIPQYTIIVLSFVISLLIIILHFLLKNKIVSKNTIFILSMANLSIIIILLLSIKPIMSYLYNNSLSRDPRMTILLLMAVVINLASLIELIITYNKSKKKEDGTEKSGSDTIHEI